MHTHLIVDYDGRLFTLNNTTEITVSCYYKPDGADIEQILRDSILLFVKSEVEKSCH